MSTKGKRPMRSLATVDKIGAIQRVNEGESKASVARDIGVPESTLRGWCKNEDKLRYMSSRLSSPDTDKSSDGEPREKRARTESPPAPVPVPAAPSPRLDLGASAASPDVPVELTTRPRDHAAPAAPSSSPHAHPHPHTPRDRRSDPGASVSMSAISPLSGYAHLGAPLSHSHLGLSFNDIANNLNLLAQLNNPALSALGTAPVSRALRSVRSPKPAGGGGALNLSERHRAPKPSHVEPPTAHSSRTRAKDPVDETLWYWLKTQQAMLDLTAQSGVTAPLHLPRAPLPEPALPQRPVVPAAPLPSHLDYAQNNWLWQYYKQYGGAIPPPDDKVKSAAQVPGGMLQAGSSENILYSQLIKGKSSGESARQSNEERAAAASPAGTENKEPATATAGASNGATATAAAAVGARGTERNHAKARTVLDSLLFHNNNNTVTAVDVAAAGEGGWENGAAEAMEHGDKFLAWLEASGDPSVTRMHVHQLRSLLLNLRARRAPATVTAAAAPAAATVAVGHSRRK